MECFLRILHTHARRYRQMTPCDAVKLAYQSVFGGGHLIPDAGASLERLRKEYEGLLRKDIGGELTEPIGGGFVRLHLSALDPELLPLEAVNAMFCRSAEMTAGDRERFEACLAEITRGCREGYLPFGTEELEAYLAAYRKNGMPAVSHSDTYREAYSPAYRIIRQEFVPYLAPIGAVYRQLAAKGRAVVAIDGMAGSGKSTLAALLAELTGGEVIHMDDFFLPPAKRTADRLAEPGGNVDYERFGEEVCPGLVGGEAFSYGVFDCSVMDIAGQRRIEAVPVRIVEGSYAMHPYFGRYAGVTLFLHLSPEEQMKRITARNGERMAEKFKNIWIPMENRYFRDKHVAERCRFVIRNDG